MDGQSSRPWHLLVLTALTATHTVNAFSRGPPTSTCLTRFPKHHNQEMQFSPSPFRISLTPQDYSPGQEITVDLHAVDGRLFKGVQISAHRSEVNTEELLGTFHRWPASKVKAMNCLDGHQNMVGHRNNEPVSNVSLSWRAPDENVGEIAFVATFVESFDVFWHNVEARLRHKDNSTIVWPSPLVPEATTVFKEIDFAACGVSKGCFLYPRTCSGSDCQAAVAWQPHGNRFLFEMFAKAEGWVSVGFSRDRLMGEDETVTCTAQQDRVTVQHGYNPGRHNDRQVRVVLDDLATMQADGKVFCRFSRPPVAQLLAASHGSPGHLTNVTFDLGQDWHVMLAWGYTFKDTDVMRIHTALPPVTSSPVTFLSAVIYRGPALPYATQVHGVLMVMAWTLLAGMTTAVARYYRDLLPGHKLCGTKVWFQIHRGLSVLAVLLTVAGIVVIFVQVGGLTKGALVHGSLGLAVGAGAVLMAAAGMLRPDITSPHRPAFNWGHRLLGVLIFALAGGNLTLAFFIDLMPDSQRHFGSVVFLAWLANELVWFVIFELRKYYRRTKTSRHFITDESKMQMQDREPSPDQFWLDKMLLALYVLCVLTFSIAGMCAILLF